jgi:FemAB-related protein (PEP-CTERM system-associated)
MGETRQNKKNILADPVAAYRNRHPQAAMEPLEILRRLHTNHMALQAQEQEIQDRTRALSRRIGNAKRDGELIDPLLASMQFESARLKTLASKRQRAETDILEFFPVEEPAARKETAATGVATERYVTSEAPEQEPAITRLDDEIEAWNAYVSSHPAASIYHRAEWRELIRQTFGHECPYYLARDRDRRVVGVLPLVHLQSRLFGNFMVSMPYFNYGGAIADHPKIEQQLMQAANTFADNSGIQHIEYRDTLPREGLPVRCKKVCMLLELPEHHEALWERFPSKLRAQIRRPQHEHPEVVQGGLEYLDDFYTVFARNMRDLGTPVYGKVFFSNILKRFPRESTIVSVRLDGKPVAAAFLIGHGERLEIPWASTIQEVNRLSVNMLLYWEVLKLGIDRHYRVFDFGRSSRDSGTFRFKRQWGAQAQPLYWHYWLRGDGKLPELNPDNPKYALAINAWKRLPVFVANRVGPAVVKYLP